MQYESIKEGITVRWNKNENTFTIKDTEFTAVEAVQMCDAIISLFTGSYYLLSNMLQPETFDDNTKAGEIINKRIQVWDDTLEMHYPKGI